ncbi:hypothetical protein ALC57_18534 [Trachymyrmex cornetzi]|uniref:Retrotransposon gag domain-containing protein n=1 Tax=Trachymyrmex cornetzi TaxID=471704 RepID=A0A151IRK1_9HYME|nr:hypothetical protein ALC57_18534 [Trachymyrmex cornetzi]
MERDKLDAMSLDQLRKLARQNNIQPAADTHAALIDAILTHLEKNVTIMEIGEEGPSTSRTSVPPPSKGKSVNQASVTTQPSVVPIDQMMEIMNRYLQQQELIFEQLRTVTRRSNDTHESSPVRRNEPTMENNSEPSPQSEGTQVTVLNTMTPANAVSTLSRQIPEFGGSEEENVLVWVQRAERVARVHGAPDEVTLLAASSKLVKSAKRWYDLQLGSALESWSCFKQELIKMFDRKISFYAAMQKIEAHRWNYHKESFDQYAIDKLALTHRLNLPQSDVINLLIGGIMKSLLRATALTPYQCKHRRGIS